MKLIIYLLFINFFFVETALAIDLIINGKRFYIREYQISEDGNEIKINHQIDLPTDCKKDRNTIAKTARFERNPASHIAPHRNPNRKMGIIQKFMMELNKDKIKRKKRHQ